MRISSSGKTAQKPFSVAHCVTSLCPFSFFVLLLLLTHVLLPQGASAAPGPLSLVFINEENTVVLTQPLEEGQCFGIRFIHSVAKSPVEEWFCAEKAQLFLEKTVYQDFGAGLPFTPEAGQRMRFEGKSIILEGFHRQFDQVSVRIGRIAHHTLLLPNARGGYDERPMERLSVPGSAITFRLVPGSTQKN